MKTLFIMRGVPGSGKSFLANELARDIKHPLAICSSDKFFDTPAGYLFDVTNLSQAHVSCMAKFLRNVLNNRPYIIFDNTNIHFWEVENYIRIATAYEYDIVVIDCQPWCRSDLKVCIERQSHSVPVTTILKLWYEYEKVSEWPEWAQSLIDAEYQIFGVDKLPDALIGWE